MKLNDFNQVAAISPIIQFKLVFVVPQNQKLNCNIPLIPRIKHALTTFLIFFLSKVNKHQRFHLIKRFNFTFESRVIFPTQVFFNLFIYFLFRNNYIYTHKGWDCIDDLNLLKHDDSKFKICLNCLKYSHLLHI